MFGGFGTHGPINNVEKYDIVNNNWINLKPLTVAKAYSTACRYDENFVFLIGGFSADNINGVYYYNLGEWIKYDWKILC